MHFEFKVIIWFWQPPRKLTKVICSVQIFQLKKIIKEEALAKQLMKLQANFLSFTNAI